MTDVLHAGECPADEQLAAYAEGLLSGEERLAVERHLAECETCREVVAEAVRLQEEPLPARVLPFWKRPKVRAIGGGVLTLAASLILVVQLRPDLNPFGRQSPLDELVAAVGKNRTVEARLSGGFQYGVLRSPTRSTSGVASADYPVLAAAARIQASADQDPSATNLHALGLGHLAVGNYEDGVAAMERAVSLAPTSELLSDLAAAYLSRGKALGRPDDYPKALSSAERAVSLDPSLVEAYFNRALALEGLNLKVNAQKAWDTYLQHDSTSEWATEAKRRRDALESVKVSRNAISTAAVAKAFAGQDADAIAKAIDESPQLVRLWMEDEGVSSVARLLTSSRSREALPALALLRNAAARLAARQDDSLLLEAVDAMDMARHGDARRLEALAMAHETYAQLRRQYARNQLEDVGRLAGSARRYFRLAQSPFEWWARHYEVVALYYAGDIAEAHEALDELQALLQGNRRYTVLTARLAWDRGTLQFARADFDAALRSYDHAYQGFARGSEGENAAAVEQLSAECLFRLGQAARGWQHHYRTLRALDQVFDLRRRHTILVAAAFWCEAQELPEAAIHLLDEALANALEWNTPEALAEVFLNRARALHLAGRSADALSNVASAHQAVAAIADRGLLAKFRGDLLAAEAMLNERTDPATAIASADEALLEYNRLSSDYRLAALYLSRARAKLNSGDQLSAEADYRRGIDQLESKRALVHRRELLVSYADSVWGLYSGLASLYVMSGRPDLALQIAERARARLLLESFESRSAGNPPAIPAVPSGLAVLYYLVDVDRVYAWALTAERSEFRVLAVSGAKLRDEVLDLLRAIIGNAPRDEMAVAAAGVYDRILRPFDSVLQPGVDLVIVPDGPLHLVPFAALMRDGRFVIERHSVTVAPSLAMLQAVATRVSFREHRDPRDAAVLAVSKATVAPQGARVPDLPAVVAESERIGSFYPAATLLTGERATVPALVNALYANDVVHFAGHAFAHPQYPWMSTLALAGDGSKSPEDFLRDVSPAAVRARLVVLAACDTAVGFQTRGEGPMSLARPFVAAGVPNVLAALWPVEDSATAALLVEFHKRYAGGSPAGRALRDAQLAMLRATNTDGHSPKAWSGFVALGAGVAWNQAPLRPTSHESNAVAGGPR